MHAVGNAFSQYKYLQHTYLHVLKCQNTFLSAKSIQLLKCLLNHHRVQLQVTFNEDLALISTWKMTFLLLYKYTITLVTQHHQIPRYIHPPVLTHLFFFFFSKDLEVWTINYLWFIEYVKEWGLNLFEINVLQFKERNDSDLL